MGLEKAKDLLKKTASELKSDFAGNLVIEDIIVPCYDPTTGNVYEITGAKVSEEILVERKRILLPSKLETRHIPIFEIVSSDNPKNKSGIQVFPIGDAGAIFFAKYYGLLKAEGLA